MFVDRHRASSPLGVGRGRARTDDRGADRRPRRPGPRRRDRHAADADHPLGRRARRAARRSRSASGAASAASASRSGRSSAAPSSRASPGSGSSGSTCPIGLVARAADPLAAAESRGPARRLDLPGLGLVSAGLFGDRLGPRPRQRASAGQPADRSARWSSASRCWPPSSRGSGAAESRCCRCASSPTAAFSTANTASLFMYFGMFGSIFLLAQFSRACRATRRWRRACGRCPGRRCRCSSPRSPARSRTGSAAGG